MISRFLIPVCLLFLASRSGLAAESRDPYQQLIANPDHLGDTERLHRLFQINWERGIRESPESATDLGYPGLDDRWTDMSERAIEQRKSEIQWPLDVLDTIKRDALSPAACSAPGFSTAKALTFGLRRATRSVIACSTSTGLSCRRA